MLRQVIRLTQPGVFRTHFTHEPLQRDAVVVRPKFLSICAADQRYFQGIRPSETLRAKLPMALLHEATAEVLYDPLGEFSVAEQVALIPCAETGADGCPANYRNNGLFHSSNCDGFTQEFLALPHHQLVRLPDRGEKLWVFLELCSVCIHAVHRWRGAHPEAGSARVGIWGDGVMGYILALTLRHLLPESHITMIGRHPDRFSLFSFADAAIDVSSTQKRNVSHAFECVGGEGASSAIADIIANIRPAGVVVLLGVSESNPGINTRMILEKGLTLLGSSRSARQDFLLALEMLGKPEIKRALGRIVSHEVVVTDAASLRKGFQDDKKEAFKTILEWNI